MVPPTLPQQAPSGALVLPEQSDLELPSTQLGTSHRTSNEDTPAAQPTATPLISTSVVAPVPPVAPRDTVPRIRRIWKEEHNVPLMQEVMACGAHVPGKCEVLTKFAAVAEKLNANTHLSLPWITNGKHCRDRFKLLMDKWKTQDRVQAAASGCEEEFGAFEQLCTDITEEMDAHKVAIEDALREKEDRAEKLLGAGAAVREMALNRYAARNAGTDSNDESPAETPSKKRRIGGSERTKNFGAAIEALESGERARTEALMSSAARENRRLEIDERRLDREAKTAEATHALNLRRMALEEQRAANDTKRDRDQAEERRMQLRIQAGMLDFLSKFADKGSSGKGQ